MMALIASKTTLNEVKEVQKKKSKEECHLCSKAIPGVLVAVCSVDKCRKGFCELCIHDSFQKDFTFKNYNPDCWVCYSCAGVCKCNKCSRRRLTGFRLETDNLLQQREIKRAQNKPLVKRRPKYYDPIAEEEYEIHFRSQAEKRTKGESGPDLKINHQHNSEEIKDEESQTKCLSLEKAISRRKKRFHKRVMLNKENIDNSKIISEVNIDSACITLYAAENEDELKDELQKRA